MVAPGFTGARLAFTRIAIYVTRARDEFLGSRLVLLAPARDRVLRLLECKEEEPDREFHSFSRTLALTAFA